MASPGDRSIPTFHANLVLANLNTDELTLELWEFFNPFQPGMGSAPAVTTTPPTTEEIITTQPPVARIALSFRAAVALKAFLDAALPPKIEERKAGE
jgi:hypothetical protein